MLTTSSVTYWKTVHVPKELAASEKKGLESRILVAGVSCFWQCLRWKKWAQKKKEKRIRDQGHYRLEKITASWINNEIKLRETLKD